MIKMMELIVFQAILVVIFVGYTFHVLMKEDSLNNPYVEFRKGSTLLVYLVKGKYNYDKLHTTLHAALVSSDIENFEICLRVGSTSVAKIEILINEPRNDIGYINGIVRQALRKCRS